MTEMVIMMSVCGGIASNDFLFLNIFYLEIMYVSMVCVYGILNLKSKPYAGWLELEPGLPSNSTSYR